MPYVGAGQHVVPVTYLFRRLVAVEYSAAASRRGRPICIWTAGMQAITSTSRLQPRLHAKVDQIGSHLHMVRWKVPNGSATAQLICLQSPNLYRDLAFPTSSIAFNTPFPRHPNTAVVLCVCTQSPLTSRGLLLLRSSNTRLPLPRLAGLTTHRLIR